MAGQRFIYIDNNKNEVISLRHSQSDLVCDTENFYHLTRSNLVSVHNNSDLVFIYDLSAICVSQDIGAKSEFLTIHKAAKALKLFGEDVESPVY